MKRIILTYTIMFIYTFLRFVIPLKIFFLYKLLFGVVLLVASQMENVFINVWGSWFSPEKPKLLLDIYAFLFTFLIVLTLLTISKDVFLIVRFLFRFVIRTHGIKYTNNQIGLVVFLLATGLSLFSFYQARHVPHVVNRDLYIKNLPEQLEGVTIVGLADLHISTVNTKKFTSGVVNKVNKLKPDLAFIAGDFVDGTIKNRGDSLDPLKDLKTKYGVYAVEGNHEYYASYQQWIKKFQSFGINMLENKNMIVDINGKKLAVIGLKDTQGTNYKVGGPDIKKALEGVPSGIPKLLMVHRPLSAAQYSKYGIDFQLSGHTHGGMMIGLNKLVIAKHNGGFVSGWYKVGNMKLYVSNGTSLWNGFPIRLGVLPEITRFVLKKER